MSKDDYLRRYVRAVLRSETFSRPAFTHPRRVQTAKMNHYDNQIWNVATRSNSGHIPDEPNRAACCFIQRTDGKILGVSRKDDPTAMGLPGGKVDPGETPEVAAARELEEETGLRATALTPVFTWMPPEREFESDSQTKDPYETTTFIADVTDIDNIGEVESEETGHIAWVTWDELLTGPFGEYNAKLKEKIEGL